MPEALTGWLVLEFKGQAAEIERCQSTFVSASKGHCIEFKYYADGIYYGLTPPG